MKKHKMDKQVQVRMPLEVWELLQGIAASRAPGTTPALLIRDAIHHAYPLGDVQSQRAAETTKKTTARQKGKPARQRGASKKKNSAD